MTSAPTSKSREITPEQFEAMQDHVRYELIDGFLRERHLSGYSSNVAGEIYSQIRNYVRPLKLGSMGTTDCGLQIFPGRPSKVLFPDVTYISRERLPGGMPKTGWVKVPPELVVEVLSPGDNANEIDEKVKDYFEAGVDLVWVVYPQTKRVTVHHPDGANMTVFTDGTITGEHVLPGFSTTVASFFPED